MNKKQWTYESCTIEPECGEPRYFGSPKWYEGCTQYRTRWWRIWFPDKTWVLSGTKESCRAYIDKVGYRHHRKHSQSELLEMLEQKIGDEEY